tara:strand:- start:58 stop:1194 length:1137 start_codon:yes stop_codon:yes gene_type:complete
MKKKSKVIIFALGGNEISPIEIDENTGKLIIQDLPAQWKRTSNTCEIIADFIKENQDCHYIITHGNGPQIGNILLRSEYSSQHLFKLPLDVCGADSQGALGYMLAQLSNSLKIRDLDINTAEIITQVEVDSNDSAFSNPTKFIGPPLSKDQAQSIMNENPNFTAKFYQILKNSNISDLDTGKNKEVWRRVVPSPKPIGIIEIDIIEACFLSGNIPITVGGGGIPVLKVAPQKNKNHETYICNYQISYNRPFSEKSPLSIFKGVEGVVDKDLSSSLLGKMILERSISRGNPLEVELVILTNVDSVKINFQEKNEKSLSLLSLEEVTSFFKSNEFQEGSMRPKIESILNFLNAGGKKAYITKVELLEKTFRGEAGTTFTN